MGLNHEKKCERTLAIAMLRTLVEQSAAPKGLTDAEYQIIRNRTLSLLTEWNVLSTKKVMLQEWEESLGRDRINVEMDEKHHWSHDIEVAVYHIGMAYLTFQKALVKLEEEPSEDKAPAFDRFLTYLQTHGKRLLNRVGVDGTEMEDFMKGLVQGHREAVDALFRTDLAPDPLKEWPEDIR